MPHNYSPAPTYHFALALLVFSLPAFGETIWFPYANVSEWGASTQSRFWGDDSSDRYVRIDNPANPNLIFNTSNALYGTDDSYFDSVDNDATYSLFLHNPTATNYTAGNRVIVQLLFADGTKIDHTDNYSGTSTPILDTTPALSSVTYDSANAQFLVSIPAGTTALIGYTEFMTPAPNNKNLAVTLKVVAVGELDTQLRARNIGFVRTGDSINAGTGVGLSDIAKMQLYTYNGISDADFTGSYHVSVLPHWREQHQKKNSAGSDWATIIRLVNTHSSADNITVDVFTEDGTLVKSHIFASVPSGGRISFAPSQFFDSVGTETVNSTGIKREGHLEIYGTAPAAVGIAGRFMPLPTKYNKDGYRRRACYTHVLPLEIAETEEP